MLWLNKFSGVVLICFTLSRWTVFTEDSPILLLEAIVIEGHGQETCQYQRSGFLSVPHSQCASRSRVSLQSQKSQQNTELRTATMLKR